MSQHSISFIGAGNMASSLIGGLIANQYSPSNIFASDPNPEQLIRLHDNFVIRTTTDNQRAAQVADVLVLCVKPQYIESVCHELKTIVKKNKPLVISIAAGVSCERLQNALSHDCAIIRVMPNTPALIGSGATGLLANKNVRTPQRDLAESLFRTVGITVWLSTENELNIVTALSGSGPAYYFLIMDILQKAAEQAGLTTETAKLLSIQTALGASRLALESDADLTLLREQVTSPGGTTEAAINILQDKKFSDFLKNALFAAIERAETLSRTSQTSEKGENN